MTAPRYYNPQPKSGSSFPASGDCPSGRVELARFEDQLSARLSLMIHTDSRNSTETALELDSAAMLRLRDGLTLALTDIAIVQDQLDRQQSLDDLMETMREAPERMSYTYIVHPDVHYVAPGQAQAKLDQLTGPCIVIEDAEIAALRAQAEAGCGSETPAPTTALACL